MVRSSADADRELGGHPLEQLRRALELTTPHMRQAGVHREGRIQRQALRQLRGFVKQRAGARW